MPTFQISLDLSRLPTRYARVAPDGTAVPSGYTKIGTFEHGPDDDSLPKASVSHVLYHHVQEALYHVKDGKTPIETGFFPDNITDMANVVIEEDVAPIAVTGVTVAPTTASLNLTETRQLTPTIAPANATNKAVTYTSSATGVATVSNTGLVTAVAVGTANITVTTTDGSKTAVCAVTVTDNG